MNVIIHYIEESDPAKVAACVERIRRYYGESSTSVPPEVWCNKPDRNGFTEYIIRLPHCESPGHLTIGAIWRTPESEVEFHS